MSSSQVESVMSQFIDAVRKLETLKQHGVLPLAYQEVIYNELNNIEDLCADLIDIKVKNLFEVEDE